jgi:hypothetical protein
MVIRPADAALPGVFPAGELVAAGELVPGRPDDPEPFAGPEARADPVAPAGPAAAVDEPCGPPLHAASRTVAAAAATAFLVLIMRVLPISRR